MYDRMALYDSLSGTISIWCLYLTILLVRLVRLDVALLLGLSLGLGMLNKTSGFLSLYMLPGTLILFDWSKKNRMHRLFKWIGLALVAAIVSQLLYSILRLSPLYAMIGQKDTVFIYSFKEWLTHPFNFVQGNIHGLFDWAVSYLTWPVYTLAILTGLTLWKWPREKLLLLGWWFAPFFALAVDGRVLYPRFILFMVLPLMVLAALGAVHIWNTFRHSVWRWAFCVLLLGGSVFTDYYIITNPLYAPIPQADAGQYIDDWPSGWGVREVNAFLTGEVAKGNVSVYTDGTFGLLPYAIEINLVDNPNMKIKGLYPITLDIPPELVADASRHPTYMIFNQTQNIPPWPIKLIASWQKGRRMDVYMRLYEVLPRSL
jgi:hypothetical protein